MKINKYQINFENFIQKFYDNNSSLNYKSSKHRIFSKLIYLYGEKSAIQIYKKLVTKLVKLNQNLKIKKRQKTHKFSKNDIIFITYPDSIKEYKIPTIQTLNKFSKIFLKNYFNTIHILPFFPYSSDRGYSVIDFKKVEPRFGDWGDIKSLSKDYRLIFDGIFNHISSKSIEFESFLKSEKKYKNYFIYYKNPKKSISSENIQKISRPRITPLLTPFQTKTGKKFVWTTFSKDQIDLNFKNSKVMLKFIDIFLFYIENGASLIRLDAINYIWKIIGTSCSHLKQTHVIIQLFKDILNLVEADIDIITETNVEYSKNISYFGNGNNEANLVYNFTLPPLVLHTIISQNSQKLLEWLSSLKYFSSNSTYFNFLQSHDGIGLNSVKKILSKDELNFLIENCKSKQGEVGYKKKGEENIPYELNITWFSALYDKSISKEINIKKYLSSWAIILFMKGIPGIYIHSLLSTKNDFDLYNRTKINRDLNRHNFRYSEILKLLNLNHNSIHKKIYNNFLDLISLRKFDECFSPYSSQKVIIQNDKIFSILREDIKQNQVLVLINISNSKQTFQYLNPNRKFTNIFNLKNNKNFKFSYKIFGKSRILLTLNPYEIKLIKFEK